MGETIHLQGIGKVPAIKASELQVGMRLTWNYGGTFEVINITPKGKCFLSVTERDLETGQDYQRALKKDRLVAGYWPKRRVG